MKVEMQGNRRNGYRVYVDGRTHQWFFNKRDAEECRDELLNEDDRNRIAAGKKPRKAFVPDWSNA